MRFHCSAPHPCLIAQHKIRLLKRNCLSLAGPKGRSSLTTLFYSLEFVGSSNRGGGCLWLCTFKPTHISNIKHMGFKSCRSVTTGTSGASLASLPPWRLHNHFHPKASPVPRGLPLLLPELVGSCPLPRETPSLCH